MLPPVNARSALMPPYWPCFCSVQPCQHRPRTRCAAGANWSPKRRQGQVRALCGEPTDVSLRGVVRRTPVYEYGYGYSRYEYYGPGWVDMPVEIWTYNFGSHKLLRKLRFVGTSWKKSKLTATATDAAA